MNPTPRQPGWFLITRHWLSLAGAALVTTAGISWLFVLPQQIRGHVSNPYIGIVVFLILPAAFFAGLALMAVGISISRRRIRQGIIQAQFDRPAALRRLVWFLGITTFLNIVIGTQITYRAVAYMDTPQFCGATCHAMRPEFEAYRNAVHSRVECAECHVVPGVAGWINSKINGSRQLIQTVLNNYERPIPSAIQSNRLVPARETCEKCHWPQIVSGGRLRIFSKFAEDEKNTRSETVLLMLVGGHPMTGIHGAHLGPGVRIRFAPADAARQTIAWVEYQRGDAAPVERFISSDPQQTATGNLAAVDMQCVDCHNRPAHSFDLPERAMDRALAMGQIPVTLPYVKKEGVELLKASYPSREEASEKVSRGVIAFYRQNYPELYARRMADVERAGSALVAIYNRNVFPDLRVTWGTYPNNLGHMDSPGCFRCHDGAHSTAGGKTITQDCNTCHEPLAMDEKAPDILKTLGIAERIANIEEK